VSLAQAANWKRVGNDTRIAIGAGARVIDIDLDCIKRTATEISVIERETAGQWGLKQHAAMQSWGRDKPIRNRWRDACRKAGVRYRFPRQLRYTYGTWTIQAGESVRWVSEQMGH
jgi:hypothetical protein